MYIYPYVCLPTCIYTYMHTYIHTHVCNGGMNVHKYMSAYIFCSKKCQKGSSVPSKLKISKEEAGAQMSNKDNNHLKSLGSNY